MGSTIIFAGHFDFGEKITEKYSMSIDEAIKLKKDIAILVGDIGPSQKLGAYIMHGAEGVKNVYIKRAECITSLCVHSQLPKKEELEDIIDEEQYRKSASILMKNSPMIFNLLKTVSVDVKNPEYLKIQDKFTKIIREKIIPEIVKDRLEAYGIIGRCSWRLYSERNMRNIVSRRLREDKPNNWLALINKIKAEDRQLDILMKSIEKTRGMPACRGIMLALYEKIAMEGYAKIIQLYPEKYKKSLIMAEELFRILEDSYPRLWPWKLKFEDKFY